MERPIIYSTPMVQATLEGRKTQTRRGVKSSNSTVLGHPVSASNSLWAGLVWDDRVYKDAGPHILHPSETEYLHVPWINPDEPDDERVFRVRCRYDIGDRLWCRQKYGVLDDAQVSGMDILYRLTDERIYAILISSEVQDGRYKVDEWSPSQAYPSLPQRGLHGGVGWSNLLTNKIQRLWAEGIRGLVSATRTQQWQGLSDYLDVSSKSQSLKECSPSDMYGFSWDTPIPIFSNTALGREPRKQPAMQPSVGNSRGELAGQKSSRTWERGRQTPNGKAIRLRDESLEVGNRERSSQPASSSEGSWDVPGWDIRRCPSQLITWRPSIHMPRWASRITQEITELRVERLQEISNEDAKAEGVEPLMCGIGAGLLGDDGKPLGLACHYISPFRELWDSLNAKRGYGWEVNPWVWVIEFEKI